MKIQRLVGGFVLAAAVVGLRPPEAAGAGIILITHGDTISHVGDVAPQFQAEVRKITQNKNATKVGFTYSYFGIFWLDLWTWGGQYCIYDHRKCWPIPAAVAAELMNKSEGDIGKPLNYRFPLGLDIVVGIVVLSITAKVLARRAENRTRRLFADPRYQKALGMITEHAEKQAADPEAEGQPASRAGFDAAVRLLISEGVSPPDAEKNLLHMLKTLHEAATVPRDGAGTVNPGSPAGAQRGQTLLVRLDRADDQTGQGLGTLPDGSHVAVEAGATLVGQEAAVVVTDVLQTPEGWMILAKPTSPRAER